LFFAGEACHQSQWARVNGGKASNRLAGPESTDLIKFLLCYLELCAADVVI
jgi:hypothetical protein